MTVAEAIRTAEEISAAKLFDQLHDFLGRFIAYPSEHARVAHTLWIAHTHAMDAWESTPRLAALSPEPASGKTRLLEISELLVPRPVEAVNVTPAYLFRKVADEEGPPTILFDEIDTVFGPKAKENEEIRGLLNAGHRRGAVAGRCVVRGKIVTTEEIPAYSAVALAGLGWLPDTLMSRSIIIRMRRRAPGERIEPFRRRVHSRQGNALRDRLASWAKGQVKRLAESWPALPAGIADRDADIWEPLVAIAEAVGGKWPERARAAAVELVKTAKEAEPSLGIRLLGDLREVFDAAGMPGGLSSVDILAGLMRLPESPWGDLKGKPLNERGLARRLRQYGVRPKKIRDGCTTFRGYLREDLQDVWERYTPPQDDRSGTSGTGGTDTENAEEFRSAQAGSSRNREAEAEQAVPVDEAETEQPIPCKTADVPCVPDVPLPGGNGSSQEAAGDTDATCDAACEFCGGQGQPGNPVLRCSYAGEDVWLHRQCTNPWVCTR